MPRRSKLQIDTDGWLGSPDSVVAGMRDVTPVTVSISAIYHKASADFSDISVRLCVILSGHVFTKRSLDCLDY